MLDSPAPEHGFTHDRSNRLILRMYLIAVARRLVLLFFVCVCVFVLFLFCVFVLLASDMFLYVPFCSVSLLFLPFSATVDGRAAA